ncbi:MAG: hypothetical protein AAB407_01405 [Patescibacteria group bacterium]
MPDFFASKKDEKALLEKLSGRELSEQEAFEAKQDLLGAFGWLLEMDKKQNPHLYENNRD